MFFPPKIYRVSELNEMINTLLSEEQVLVSGEISDFRVVRDKYVYFDLKDETSRISCFMMLFSLHYPVENGMEVKIFGSPGVYVPYGKLTFRVQTIEPIGEGALRKSFELLKRKLEEEGLFRLEHKQTLPRFPQRIGLITARASAAESDVLRILKNRWAGLEIFIRHSLVQGDGAIDELASAINFFNQHYPVDVIILTRGGGSLEDLAAFNSEAICRAVFASKIPIIAAVGHERDETLVEFVADQRGSTPSNAAEIAVPEKRDWLHRLEQKKKQLRQILKSNLMSSHDELENLRSLIQKAFSALIEHKKSSLEHLKRLFSTLNPERPLEQGYSLSFMEGKLVRSIAEIKINDLLETRFQRGQLISKVLKKHI